MSRLRIFRGLDFFFILYLYAYLRHAFCWVRLRPHDRRCRSSVVGYLETCTSGTLTPWLSIDWAWCRFVGAGYHVVWVGYVALL